MSNSKRVHVLIRKFDVDEVLRELWEVEVKTANPVHNTQETPLSKSIEAILEVQMLMKGLLDLRRKDV